MRFPFHRILITAALALVLSVPVRAGSRGTTEITLYGGASFIDISTQIAPTCRFCLGPITVQNDVMIPPFFSRNESLTGSFLLGLKVGYAFSQHGIIEGNFSVAPHHTLREVFDINCPPGQICPLGQVGIGIPSVFREDHFVAYGYDVNFAYAFTTTRTIPYVTAGIGGVSYDIEDGFKTNFAFNVGAGIKIFTGNHVGFRIELNEHVIPNHYLTHQTASNLQVQGGLVFRLT